MIFGVVGQIAVMLHMLPGKAHREVVAHRQVHRASDALPITGRGATASAAKNPHAARRLIFVPVEVAPLAKLSRLITILSAGSFLLLAQLVSCQSKQGPRRSQTASLRERSTFENGKAPVAPIAPMACHAVQRCEVPRLLPCRERSPFETAS